MVEVLKLSSDYHATLLCTEQWPFLFLQDCELRHETHTYGKAELFLQDASQQPSVMQDVDSTFICDANGEV